MGSVVAGLRRPGSADADEDDIEQTPASPARTPAPDGGQSPRSPPAAIGQLADVLEATEPQ